MRAGAAQFLLVAFLVGVPTGAADPSYATTPVGAGLFVEGSARAVQNATDALAVARVGLPADRFAANASGVAAELTQDAELPEEATVRVLARREAAASLALADALARLVETVGKVDVGASRLASDEVATLVDRIAHVQRAAARMRDLGHDVAALEENATLFLDELRAKGGPDLLLLLPPQDAVLGARLPVRVLVRSIQPPLGVDVALDEGPPVPAPLGNGTGEALLDVPLDARLLGPHALSARARLPDGTVLAARIEIAVARHPTRILVEGGVPRVRSALGPDLLRPEDAPALERALRGAVVLVRRETGEGAPGQAFEASRAAAILFDGTDVLAPSQAAHVPVPAPASFTDALVARLGGAAVLVAALALVAVVAARARKSTRTTEPTPPEGALAASAPRPAFPTDGGEPGAHVVAAYRAARDSAVQAGVGHPRQTPREWGREVARRLDLSADALVAAYERARFSPAPPAEAETAAALVQARGIMEALP